MKETSNETSEYKFENRSENAFSNSSGTRLETAVYGKGGIGKSTVSAALAAALAIEGTRVLQIGCDPKHDSTRLLMHGETIPTILDVLREKGKDAAQLEDVLRKGFREIGCIEAGGPRPGVGCAGRGIISALEFLDKYHVKENYDMVLYDVLGDVVCGGFAVPVRREYADAIFLVVSGEYMALYAANNILRGIRNYDGDTHCRVAGIIYNERKLPDEAERIRRFSETVRLPVVAKVPRSDDFARAEAAKCTVMELEGADPDVQGVFLHLARYLLSGPKLYPAKPVSDEALEAAILRNVAAVSKNETAYDSDSASKTAYDSVSGTKNELYKRVKEETQIAEKAEPEPESALEHLRRQALPKRAPLYGCAFNGAASAAVHLQDAFVIAHGPKACAFYTWQNITSPVRKNLYNRGILMPSALTPNFGSSDMEHSEAVFGGMDRLRTCLEKVAEKKPSAIIIISTCVSGIIGDDIAALEELSTAEMPIITIAADGDIAGDYMQGIRMAMHKIALSLVDPDCMADRKTRLVNLIGETGISYNNDVNFEIMKRMLSPMDIRINCRYLGNATVDEVRGLLKAPLNILSSDSADALELKAFMTENFDCAFLDESLPVGYEASTAWIRKLGNFFHCPKEAEKAIEGEKKRYEQALSELRLQLTGKKIFMTTINSNIDWLLDAATDAGMTFVYIGVMNYLHTPVSITKYPERYPGLDPDFDWSKMQEKIRECQPDIILANYTPSTDYENAVTDSLSMIPLIGFDSGLDVLARWADLLKMKEKEVGTDHGSWKDDRTLFEKYYT